MVKFSLFSVFAAVLCAASLLSCSSDPTDDTPSSSSAKLSSSSAKVSSSSSEVVSSSSSEDVSSSSSAGGVAGDPDLIKKTITLSYAGNSYADIDGNIATYKQADANSRLDKIDLIAYCGTNAGWCENNSIYTPFAIDLFWSNEYDFLGSLSVSLFKIPAAQAEVFKTATKRSEIAEAFSSLLPIFEIEENYLDEIPIVVGNVFFASTSEENIHIIVIKATGDQSVDLEVIQIPL